MPILVGMMRMMSNHVKLIVSMAIANNWEKNPQRKPQENLDLASYCCPHHAYNHLLQPISHNKFLFLVLSLAEPLQQNLFFFFFVPWKKHTMH